MPQRKSKLTEQQKPSIILRRSPRFRQIIRIEPQNPETPNHEHSKIRVFSTTPQSYDSSVKTQKKSQKRASKPVKERALKQERKETVTGSKSSKNLSNGSRRRTRSELRIVKIDDSPKKYVIEKRVTRSATRVNKNVAEKSTVLYDEDKDKGVLISSKKLDKRVTWGNGNAAKNSRVLYDEEKDKGDSDLSKKLKKRVTRSSSHVKENRKVVKSGIALDAGEENVVVSNEGKVKRGSRKLVDKENGDGDKKEEECKRKNRVESGDVDVKEEKECKGKSRVGEKRKRTQIEDERRIAQGWSKEQELALRRAYLTAVPTPHFWKKVAKMVPGKSAQECFDRIHSDHATPPQPRSRSGAKKNNLSSTLSLSTCNLLSPTDKKVKRLKSSKRNKLMAQKTVRQILEKQQSADKDYEADLFSVLEGRMSPSSPFSPKNTATFDTPPRNQVNSWFRRCSERSSSARKKQLSRLSSPSMADFSSPPVLKQIKNKALHEKYIDQLHCRDAKRKAAARRNGKNVPTENGNVASQVNAVKFARDALVFDAQDAIKQFKLQSAMLDNDVSDDDDCFRDPEDEDEDEL